MKNLLHSAVRAPELALPGLRWFNVERPLSLAGLRGRLVILDFWTFCCINCMHLVPTLRRVEEAFAEEVVVIGVHSPKFAAEREAANVAQAIARHGIVHPVVHDPEFLLWREYTVRAWPTLVFIGPDGRVLGQNSGEPDPQRLLELVELLVQEARAGGALRPARLELKPTVAPSRRLRYPAKLKPLPRPAVNRPGGARHWALADAGHHQVVILDDAGQEIMRIGSGQAGFVDGTLEEATFHSPQGLICAEGTLYVADTGNHAIRRADLVAGRLETLAGSGARGPALGDPVPARGAALASPWDLEQSGSHLYFANAGTHQLGLLDLEQGTVRALAGDSGEAIVDGPARAARLAQPSGLALDAEGARLYFVDSETSSVRVVEDVEGEPMVRTLAGTGLFDFGHVNGPLAEARFQHPLGIAVHDGRLLVADSYNGALRAIELARGEVRDFDENFACEDTLCIPAAEPAGVWADGAGRVFLVDTNNHRVLEFDPTRRAYHTWVG